MSTADDYRINAEDCLRMAKKAAEERDRPLWATMAQSWLRLAEHAERTVPAADGAAKEDDAEADHVECVALAPEGFVEQDRVSADDAEEEAATPRATN
jgi:hypothetical protein